jgi:hypothetical protein
MQASFGRVRRVVAGIAFASALVSLISCAESASAPHPVRDDAAAANSSLLGGLLGGLQLLNCTTQPYDSVTQVIGASGGIIHVGPHRFVVPPGALSSNTSITAVTPSVNRREVRFQPHGLVFDEPTYLTMSYSGCSLVSQLLPKRIGYTSSSLTLLYLIPSLDNFFTKKVTGRIDHFSGYVLWQ